MPARLPMERTHRCAVRRSSRCPSWRSRIDPCVRSPIARSIVRATLGTSGIVVGLLPLPMICNVRCPPLNARSSMFVPHASLTRRPLSPRRTASAARCVLTRSALNRNLPSSVRSSPRPCEGWTCGRRTYWAGFEVIRPSMWAKR